VTDTHGHRLESQCQANVFLRDPRAALPREVAAEIVGKKAGDSLTAVVERTVKTKAGKEVTHADTYAVTLREIKTMVLPALDDEFAKDVGDFENLAALRKRILDDLVDQQEQSKRAQVMEKVFDHVFELVPFDAPRKIVAAQEYQTILRDSAQLQRFGLDFSAVGQSTEGYLEQARANSERLVKVNIAIKAIAEKDHIEVTDAEVDKEIERRAEEAGRKPLAIRARLEAEKKLDALKQDLLLQKVEDFLMEKNTVNVVEPKTDEKKS
jgi:trigger factor